MACILCFSSKHDVGKESEDFYGIYDYNEKNGISAVEMIKCHLNYLTGVSEIFNVLYVFYIDFHNFILENPDR